MVRETPVNLENAKAPGRRKAVPLLLEELRSPDPGVSSSAAWVLDHLGGRLMVRGCQEILRSEAPVTARENAAYLLINAFDRTATPDLIAVLSNRNDAPRVRAQAAETLGMLYQLRDRRKFAFRKTAEALMSVLDDPSPEVRFWTVFALGVMRCRKALAQIEHLAATDFALCPGWWTVAEEAEDMAYTIRHRRPPPWDRERNTAPPFPAGG